MKDFVFMRSEFSSTKPLSLLKAIVFSCALSLGATLSYSATPSTNLTKIKNMHHALADTTDTMQSFPDTTNLPNGMSFRVFYSYLGLGLSEQQLYTFFSLSYDNTKPDARNIDQRLFSMLLDSLSYRFPGRYFLYNSQGLISFFDPCDQNDVLGTVSLGGNIIICDKSIASLARSYHLVFPHMSLDIIVHELRQLVHANESWHKTVYELQCRDAWPLQGSFHEYLFLSAVRVFFSRLYDVTLPLDVTMHDIDEAMSDIASLASGGNQQITSRFLFQLDNSAYSPAKNMLRAMLFDILGYDPSSIYPPDDRCSLADKASMMMQNLVIYMTAQDFATHDRLRLSNKKIRYVFPRTTTIKKYAISPPKQKTR